MLDLVSLKQVVNKDTTDTLLMNCVLCQILMQLFHRSCWKWYFLGWNEINWDMSLWWVLQQLWLPLQLCHFTVQQNHLYNIWQKHWGWVFLNKWGSNEQLFFRTDILMKSPGSTSIYSHPISSKRQCVLNSIWDLIGSKMLYFQSQKIGQKVRWNHLIKTESMLILPVFLCMKSSALCNVTGVS